MTLRKDSAGHAELSPTSWRVATLQGGAVGTFLIFVGVVIFFSNGVKVLGTILCVVFVVGGAFLLRRGIRAGRTAARGWPHLRDDGDVLTLIHTDGRQETTPKADIASVAYDAEPPGRWTNGLSVVRPLRADGTTILEWKLCPLILRKEMRAFLDTAGLALAPR